MPLPFGLKLKRTRRYTVSSKSCLVTRIQQLNGEFVEFTLSVESTGQECLEAVAQRLELREVCTSYLQIQMLTVLSYKVVSDSQSQQGSDVAVFFLWGSILVRLLQILNGAGSN